MGRTPSPPLKDPYEIARTRAHAYLYHGKYPQVQVFTKYLSETDHLQQEFGGNHYRHGTGYTWQLAKRGGVIAFIEKTKPYWPSQYGFELVVARVLGVQL